MSYTDEYDAIAGHFSTEWATLHSDIPIAWQDVRFKPTPGTAFVRFSRQSGGEAQIGICGGGGAYRNAGVVYVQIFTPRGDGGALSRELIDDATGIFRGQYIDGVSFGNIEITDNIESPDSAWYGVSISFFYKRWEVFQ